MCRVQDVEDMLHACARVGNVGVVLREIQLGTDAAVLLRLCLMAWKEFSSPARTSLTQEALAAIGIKAQINKIPGATWRAARTARRSQECSHRKR